MRALALILAASPAMAADEWPLPESCSGVVTVQAADCTVTHYYRCDGDAPGAMRRDDLEEDGLVFRSRTDNEARWIESEHVEIGITDILGAERDPASLSDLLATGRDDFDFLTYSSDGQRQRYIGFDALTGEEVVIDGVPLKRTAFEMRVEDMQGNWLWSSVGNEYVSDQWRIFIGGTRTVSSPQEEFVRDGTPERVVLPGEPGFLARRPIYGCGVMMSGLPAIGGAG